MKQQKPLYLKRLPVMCRNQGLTEATNAAEAKLKIISGNYLKDQE